MSDDENSELVRLQRLLAMAGIGSRRHCEDYITTGRVTVDGRTVTELGARVNPETQDVRLDGERVKVARKTYYMLNKPTGVLCTNQDPEGRMRVTDLFPKSTERLFTVGRLDENSEGLLLVTNDGDLAHRMAHPRFHVEKIYRVQVAGVPTREIVEQLQEGMYFSEGRFAAKSARLVKSKGHSALLEIVLTEGQNREIRRLLAKVGHKVQRLTRVGLGPLRLGELPVGEHRRLTSEEIRRLHDLASGRQRPDRRPKPGGKPGRRPARGEAGRRRPERSRPDRSRPERSGRPAAGPRRGKPTDRARPGRSVERPAPAADAGDFVVIRKGFRSAPESDQPVSRPRPPFRGDSDTPRPRRPTGKPGPASKSRSAGGPPPRGPASSDRPARGRPPKGKPPTGRKSRPPSRPDNDDDLPEA